MYTTYIYIYCVVFCSYGCYFDISVRHLRVDLKLSEAAVETEYGRTISNPYRLATGPKIMAIAFAKTLLLLRRRELKNRFCR